MVVRHRIIERDRWDMRAHHHLQATVDIAPTALQELFAVRPARWLHGFLRLAILAASDAVGTAATSSWYRLGPPLPDESGHLTASFVWWPHAGADLFERFAGHFAVLPRSDGATLVLEGDTVGGAEQRDAAVLQMLVNFIGSAISADQAS